MRADGGLTKAKDWPCGDPPVVDRSNSMIPGPGETIARLSHPNLQYPGLATTIVRDLENGTSTIVHKAAKGLAIRQPPAPVLAKFAGVFYHELSRLAIARRVSPGRDPGQGRPRVRQGRPAFEPFRRVDRSTANVRSRPAQGECLPSTGKSLWEISRPRGRFTAQACLECWSDSITARNLGLFLFLFPCTHRRDGDHRRSAGGRSTRVSRTHCPADPS